MIKIAHFGSYDSNIGDNIALKVVRKSLEDSLRTNVEWKSIKLSSFSSYSINGAADYFTSINNTCDALLIGGGGLFEGGPYSTMPTGWKLPFDEQILSKIEIPIIVFAAGINYFRKVPKFNEKGKKAFISLLDRADLISLRNDGSIVSAEELLQTDKGIFNKIIEVPDPGLIIPENLHKTRIHSCKKQNGAFQQARNSGNQVNYGRFETEENMKSVYSFALDEGLFLLPHTPKDFQGFQGKNIISRELLLSQLPIDNVFDFIKIYHKFDYCIPMRGHGQLISTGINCPFVSLSTQDKVRDFADRNGFREFNVDIQEADWLSSLKKKISSLENDKDYLLNWYEIRDRNIATWNTQFHEFSKKVSNIIKEKE